MTTSVTNAPLMLLDGASLWFRAFHALPEKMTAPDGRPVNAVRGFVDMIAALVRRERPARLVVCLDLDWRPAFRTDLIPSYKAHRVVDNSPGAGEEVPDTLSPQVEMIMSVLGAAGVATAGAPACEADDVIGTLAVRETVSPVIVVSGDRDLLQLVADDPVSVRVLYVGRGLAKAQLFGPAEVAQSYEIPAGNAGTAYADMAILRGDPSDGLPGVHGIGEKTAARLIREFGDVDAVEEAAREHRPPLTRCNATAIAQAHDYLAAARTVVYVRKDADVALSGPDTLPRTPADIGGLHDLAVAYGISSSVARLAEACEWDEWA